MSDIKDILQKYLSPTLGSSKNSYSQLRFCCPLCDSGKKYNLEINCNSNSSKYLLYNCWSCGYSGYITQLLKDYAINPLWKSLPEFKGKQVFNKTEKEQKILVLPEGTTPYYHNIDVEKYLTIERKIKDEELIKRNIRFCFHPESKFYNSIIFPFYNEEKELIAFSSQDFKTKKYRNNGSLNFIPYKEFINPYFPIILTEGIYDALSVPNAIPLLGTNIYSSVLRYCQDKKIILALDNEEEVSMEYKKQLVKKIYTYGAKLITILNLYSYKDLNDFLLKDSEKLKFEIKILFELLINAEG